MNDESNLEQNNRKLSDASLWNDTLVIRDLDGEGSRGKITLGGVDCARFLYTGNRLGVFATKE